MAEKLPAQASVNVVPTNVSTNVPPPVYHSNVNPNQPVTDWPNNIYDGLSDLGLFKADLGMIIGLIIGLILIVLGIYLMVYDEDHKYLRITGQITQPNCVKSSTTYDEYGKQTDSYKCNLNVTYQINGKTYSRKIYVSGTNNYINDEPISLMVMKDNHEDVQVAYMNRTTLASILFIVSILLIGICYLNFYVTHNYKVFSASQGANTIVSLFR
jgi:hypothetical protein